MHVLFVCSKNQWRSPTGEEVFRRSSGLSVRSAGTSRSARRQVTVKDIRWADVILVMEQKHKSRLMAEFRDEVRYTELHVLDIPDDYGFMDPELVELLREGAAPYLLTEEDDDGADVSGR
ncbi:MAG: phosphotyrosine protein phosphatase [Planctomycetota bacterium]